MIWAENILQNQKWALQDWVLGAKLLVIVTDIHGLRGDDYVQFAVAHLPICGEKPGKKSRATVYQPVKMPTSRPSRSRTARVDPPIDPVAQIFEENQALRAELSAARQSFRSERAAREEVQDVLHQMRADITRLLSVSEKALWDSMPPPPPPPEKRAEEPEREVAGKPAPEPGQPRPDPEPPRTVEEALSLIYRRKESETCATVAEALHLVPMQDWEPEEFRPAEGSAGPCRRLVGGSQ